jgi:hypothetical protein
MMMTDTSVAVAHATDNFRLGSIISRSGALLSRHLLTFLIVSLIAYSPTVLIGSLQSSGRQAAILASVLMMVLGTLGFAIVLHAAFQDMRGQPVRLADSLNVALGRFWPLIGLALLFGFLVTLGLVLLIVPGLIVYTMWFVALPACVVERCGPRTSLRRSQELTKGYRWKLFAFTLPIFVVNFGSSLIASWLGALAGPVVGIGGQWIWTGIWAAFCFSVITVTYCDLRVIKEGVDIDEIAAVFD